MTGPVETVQAMFSALRAHDWAAAAALVDADGGGVGRRLAMTQSILHVALVVRDYDEAIAFFTQTLDFKLVEDTYQPDADGRRVPPLH